MNAVIFIPAKGQSQSIPRKNLKLLENKPLISWSIESGLRTGLPIYVSTDDKEIADIARSYNAKVLERPSSLAKDKTSMFEVLKNEIPKIKSNPDTVVLFQPTSPLRKNVIVQTALSYFKENFDKYDSLISVEKVPDKYNPAQVILNHNGQKGMVIAKLENWKEKIKSYFTGIKYTVNLSGVPIYKRLTRRQDHPKAFIPTGEIYIFKTSNLKDGSIYGNETLLLETNGTPNLNNLDDWAECEKILNEKK